MTQTLKGIIELAYNRIHKLAAKKSNMMTNDEKRWLKEAVALLTRGMKEPEDGREDGY